MIVEEIINETMVRTASSEGKHIQQVETGLIMESAIDAYPNPYTYIEIEDEDIPKEEPTEDEYAEVGKILIGES